MDVYLVPASRDRYALYCEGAHAAPVSPVTDDQPTGWRARWSARAIDIFRRLIDEGDAARHSMTAAPDALPHGRVRRYVTRHLAEAVAEQRLLWHLRHQTTAHLMHPDDLTPAAATDASRSVLIADRDRHRRWCAIDGVFTIVSAPFALLPGPNFLAYYFIFRTVGHFLSMQGAQQGLSTTAWTTVPSPHLTGIRTALAMDKARRAARVDEIAAALGLDRLGPFVDRITER